MSAERTVKPFRLASGVVRDKDNAMPREPRPQFLPNDHPRLAPPGMSGVRAAKRFDLPRLPVQDNVKVGKRGRRRRFKLLFAAPDETAASDNGARELFTRFGIET